MSREDSIEDDLDIENDPYSDDDDFEEETPPLEVSSARRNRPSTATRRLEAGTAGSSPRPPATVNSEEKPYEDDDDFVEETVAEGNAENVIIVSHPRGCTQEEEEKEQEATPYEKHVSKQITSPQPNLLSPATRTIRSSISDSSDVADDYEDAEAFDSFFDSHVTAGTITDMAASLLTSAHPSTQFNPEEKGLTPFQRKQREIQHKKDAHRKSLLNAVASLDEAYILHDDSDATLLSHEEVLETRPARLCLTATQDLVCSPFFSESEVASMLISSIDIEACADQAHPQKECKIRTNFFTTLQALIVLSAQESNRVPLEEFDAAVAALRLVLKYKTSLQQQLCADTDSTKLASEAALQQKWGWILHFFEAAPHFAANKTVRYAYGELTVHFAILVRSLITSDNESTKSWLRRAWTAFFGSFFSSLSDDTAADCQSCLFFLDSCSSLFDGVVKGHSSIQESTETKPKNKLHSLMIADRITSQAARSVVLAKALCGPFASDLHCLLLNPAASFLADYAVSPTSGVEISRKIFDLWNRVSPYTDVSVSLQSPLLQPKLDRTTELFIILHKWLKRWSLQGDAGVSICDTAASMIPVVEVLCSSEELEDVIGGETWIELISALPWCGGESANAADTLADDVVAAASRYFSLLMSAVATYFNPSSETAFRSQYVEMLVDRLHLIISQTSAKVSESFAYLVVVKDVVTTVNLLLQSDKPIERPQTREQIQCSLSDSLNASCAQLQMLSNSRLPLSHTASMSHSFKDTLANSGRRNSSLLPVVASAAIFSPSAVAPPDVSAQTGSPLQARSSASSWLQGIPQTSIILSTITLCSTNLLKVLRVGATSAATHFVFPTEQGATPEEAKTRDASVSPTADHVRIDNLLIENGFSIVECLLFPSELLRKQISMEFDTSMELQEAPQEIFQRALVNAILLFVHVMQHAKDVSLVINCIEHLIMRIDSSIRGTSNALRSESLAKRRGSEVAASEGITSTPLLRESLERVVLSSRQFISTLYMGDSDATAGVALEDLQRIGCSVFDILAESYTEITQYPNNSSSGSMVPRPAIASLFLGSIQAIIRAMKFVTAISNQSSETHLLSKLCDQRQFVLFHTAHLTKEVDSSLFTVLSAVDTLASCDRYSAYLRSQELARSLTLCWRQVVQNNGVESLTSFLEDIAYCRLVANILDRIYEEPCRSSSKSSASLELLRDLCRLWKSDPFPWTLLGIGHSVVLLPILRGVVDDEQQMNDHNLQREEASARNETASRRLAEIFAQQHQILLSQMQEYEMAAREAIVFEEERVRDSGISVRAEIERVRMEKIAEFVDDTIQKLVGGSESAYIAKEDNQAVTAGINEKDLLQQNHTTEMELSCDAETQCVIPSPLPQMIQETVVVSEDDIKTLLTQALAAQATEQASVVHLVEEESERRHDLFLLSLVELHSFALDARRALDQEIFNEEKKKTRAPVESEARVEDMKQTNESEGNVPLLSVQVKQSHSSGENEECGQVQPLDVFPPEEAKEGHPIREDDVGTSELTEANDFHILMEQAALAARPLSSHSERLPSSPSDFSAGQTVAALQGKHQQEEPSDAVADDIRASLLTETTPMSTVEHHQRQHHHNKMFSEEADEVSRIHTINTSSFTQHESTSVHESTASLYFQVEGLLDELHMKSTNPLAVRTCVEMLQQARSRDMSVDHFTKVTTGSMISDLKQIKKKAVAVIRAIEQREAVLDKIHDFVARFERNPHFFSAGITDSMLGVFIQDMRVVSVRVVEAITSWRVAQREFYTRWSEGSPSSALLETTDANWSSEFGSFRQQQQQQQSMANFLTDQASIAPTATTAINRVAAPTVFLYQGKNYLEKMKQDLHFLTESGVKDFVHIEVEKNVVLMTKKRTASEVITEPKFRGRNFFARLSAPKGTLAVSRAAGHLDPDEYGIKELIRAADDERSMNTWFQGATAPEYQIVPAERKTCSSGSKPPPFNLFKVLVPHSWRSQMQMAAAPSSLRPMSALAGPSAAAAGHSPGAASRRPHSAQSRSVGSKTISPPEDALDMFASLQHSTTEQRTASIINSSGLDGNLPSVSKLRKRLQAIHHGTPSSADHQNRLWRRNPLQRFAAVAVITTPTVSVSAPPTNNTSNVMASPVNKSDAAAASPNKHNFSIAINACGMSVPTTMKTRRASSIGGGRYSTAVPTSSALVSSRGAGGSATPMMMTVRREQLPTGWDGIFVITLAVFFFRKIRMRSKERVSATIIQRWYRRCFAQAKFGRMIEETLAASSEMMSWIMSLIRGVPESECDAGDNDESVNEGGEDRPWGTSTQHRGGGRVSSSALVPKYANALQLFRYFSVATSKIQKQYRRYTRRKLVKRLIRFMIAALKIQRWWRIQISVMRLKKVAKVLGTGKLILMWIRRCYQRCAERIERRRVRNAIRIQRWTRVRSAMRMLHYLRKRLSCAIHVQRVVRGWLGRRRFKLAKHGQVILQFIKAKLWNREFALQLLQREVANRLRRALQRSRSQRELAERRLTKAQQMRVYLHVDQEAVWRSAGLRICAAYKGWKTRRELAAAILHVNHPQHEDANAQTDLNTHVIPSSMLQNRRRGSPVASSMNHMVCQVVSEYVPSVVVLQCFFRKTLARAELLLLRQQKRTRNVYFNAWMCGSKRLSRFRVHCARLGGDGFLAALRRSQDRAAQERRRQEELRVAHLRVQNVSATKIESVWRMYATRQLYLDAKQQRASCIAEQHREELVVNLVIGLQRVVRQFLVLRHWSRVIRNRRQIAARVIQRVWRINLEARADLERRLQEYKKCSLAAFKIQIWFRACLEAQRSARDVDDDGV